MIECGSIFNFQMKIDISRSQENKGNVVGATYCAIIKFLHPRKAIKNKYPNASNTTKTEKLLCSEKKNLSINANRIVLCFDIQTLPMKSYMFSQDSVEF